jgi:enoyl-CoA hydratase/carnithine racemase
MDYETVILDKTNGVATITLNRPQVLNAISTGLLNDLRAALTEAGEDSAIGVIVITGAGRAFSAGVDIKTKDAAGQPVSPKRELALEVIAVIEGLDKAVIAAVNGHCLTGALELATACDIIVAGESAVFGDTHARWGLTPTWGGSQRLPRLIGAQKAKELFFTGDILSATEAERIGIVNRVVADDMLVEEVSAMTAKILANSPETIRIEKSLVNRGLRMTWEDGLALELRESHGRTDGSAERMEGFGKG